MKKKRDCPKSLKKGQVLYLSLFQRFWTVPFFLMGLSLNGWAATPLLSVKIKGNQRIEAAAILNQISTKPPAAYSSRQIRESIAKIYALGFFDDIVVDAKTTPRGVHLTYLVKEKPAIRKIDFEGHKKIDLSDIREAVDIRPYAILDLNKIQLSKDKIVKLYEQKGFFLAKVTHRLDRHPRENEVDLIFEIDEFDKVKIRKIAFIGNHSFSDDTLKNTMATKEKGFFSWLTKSDNYQEDIFKADIQRLTYFYHTKGHAQVKVDPPVVTVSFDKKWIHISVMIHEGGIYRVGRVDYDGELIFSVNELKKNRQLKEEEVFNLEKLQSEVSRLADKYKDEGYAYANVNVKSDVRDDEKKIYLTFNFEKGQKVYFGKINILGNSNTRDKVVRRELKIHEGDLYNETRLRKSIERVQALGFFSEVTTAKPQGEDANLIDLDISVTERTTGALTLGAGWSSVDNFIANAQISHNNLFGRGHAISLNAQLSGASNRFSFSFTEPYTFDSLWSSGVDGYKTAVETVDYTELKTGGDIRLGYPIGEYMNTHLTYKLEDLEYDKILKGSKEDLEGEGVVSSVLNTLIYDRRNNRFEPTQGIYDMLILEFAGLGGDNHFFKSLLNARFYTPAFLDGVFRINTELGLLTRTTSAELPTTERFKLGGMSSLRGFEPFSVGPAKISTTGESLLIGGDRQFLVNLEYELPLVRAMGMKGVLFYDIGSAFDGSRIEDVRHDVGFGFRWFSPFGPIRVEVGFPLDRKEGERKSVTQFAITPPF